MIVQLHTVLYSHLGRGYFLQYIARITSTLLNNCPQSIPVTGDRISPHKPQSGIACGSLFYKRVGKGSDDFKCCQWFQITNQEILCKLLRISISCLIEVITLSKLSYYMKLKRCSFFLLYFDVHLHVDLQHILPTAGCINVGLLEGIATSSHMTKFIYRSSRSFSLLNTVRDRYLCRFRHPLITAIQWCAGNALHFGSGI